MRRLILFCLILVGCMSAQAKTLTGKYNIANPMPEGSGRAATYNSILTELESLTAAMEEIGENHDASISQIAIAYAIAKGALPLVGVTKPRHVEEAAASADIKLSETEITRLEQLALAAGVDTKGSWENPMI